MKIAVFDHITSRATPIGQLQLKIINALRHEHEFTVYAIEFANPDPSRIRWVKIPVIRSPGFAMFLLYYAALSARLVWRDPPLKSFDIVQRVESKMPVGQVNYAHFCHRSFLRHHWRGINPGGLRGVVRWLDHQVHALAEPSSYRDSRYIVVPSQGLKRELEAEYPVTRGRIRVISNPVNLAHFRRPDEFDRAARRRELGLADTDTVLIFIALGQFERKGLPLLLQAMATLGRPDLKLLVVGGEADLLRKHIARTKAMGLADQVQYVGKQSDVRPFLYMADAFAFPSLYEVFSLVALEAAAAGLPLLITPLNGVEEYLQDGSNGILAQPTVDGVTVALHRFLAMNEQERQAMGKQALQDVQQYDDRQFIDAWRIFYNEVQSRP